MKKLTVHIEIDLENRTADMTLSGGAPTLVDPLIRHAEDRILTGPFPDCTAGADSFDSAVREIFGDALDYFLSAEYFSSKNAQETSKS